MITSRLLTEDDIEPVLGLMRLSLGETPLLMRSPELFRWKHIDNPFGRSISLVAEADNRIVGLRTFMRWNLTTQDSESVNCVRAVDTATHPEYLRRGIFKRLTEEAVEVAKDDEIDFVFNTPNSKSKPGYLKMGWREVGNLGAMIRPSWSVFRGGRDVHSVEPDEFIGDPQPVVDSQMVDRQPLGLRTVKNERYIRWRFMSHPIARYFAIRSGESTALVRPNIRRKRRELVLADLFGPPQPGVNAAISEAKSGYMATWFSAGSPERAATKRRGFVALPGYTTLSLVMRPLRELPSDWESMKSWDVAVSDFELL